MRKLLILGVLLVTVLLMTGCLAGPNEMVDAGDDEGTVAGFWRGLWHGIIAPVTFIVSLFTKNVQFYEVHNNGNWYNFGFVIGAGILFGGGSAGRRRKRRHDD